MSGFGLPSWLLWSLLSAVFAALTAIFVKLGVSGINPDMATFIRTLVVVALLGLLLLATGHFESPGKIPPRVWLYLALSGAATGASWLCYFRALKIGDAARVAPIDKLSVVLVAVFGVCVLGERMTLTGWAGILLIAAGAALVAIS